MVYIYTPSWQENWIRWWRQAFGWSLLTRGGDDQQWLPWDSPDMVRSRQETLELIQEKGVHPYLVLNYDQLWRQSWSTSKFKLHYKHRSGAGKRVAKRKAGAREDKKIHAVRGSRRSITVTLPLLVNIDYWQTIALHKHRVIIRIITWRCQEMTLL